MSAFVMFALKRPSLLAFDEDARAEGNANLKTLYHIENIPSDTRMREILDEVPPEELRPGFNALFCELQRGKGLNPFVFYQGHYLASLDGTQYFSSQNIHCDQCQQRVSKDGQVSYHHQMLTAVLVHPDKKEAIPIALEPIVRQDGETKNDCERNAGVRLLRQLRKDHPKLKLIVVEDGLGSNAPHIRLLKELNFRFILGVKEGDHAYFFEQVIKAHDEGRVIEFEVKDMIRPGVTHVVTFVNQIPLNASNPDLLVNYLAYQELDADGNIVKRFTWVTDLTITRSNAFLFVRGGRARWKIENETFNTLKNQGYHFEHNFGHGYKNLSVVFAFLMFLAFMFDQIQQLCCPLFQAVWEKLGSKRSLWEHLRSHYDMLVFGSIRHLYLTILYGSARGTYAPPIFDSS